jgi:SET domain-containing protein
MSAIATSSPDLPKKVFYITGLRYNVNKKTSFAELREVESDELCIAAMLDYIIRVSVDRGYNVVNLKETSKGNYKIEVKG